MLIDTSKENPIIIIIIIMVSSLGMEQLGVSANHQQQWSRLLDFSQAQMDIELLDTVVAAFYTGQGPQQTAAQTVLRELKEHPDSWTRVDAILEYSRNPQTKYYALQILETLVSRRWKALPPEQREGK